MLFQTLPCDIMQTFAAYFNDYISLYTAVLLYFNFALISLENLL